MVANFFTLMKVLGYLGVPKNAWAFSNFKKCSANEPSTVKPTQQFRKVMQNNLSILYPFGKFGGVTYVKVMDAIREKFTLVPTDYQHQF